MNCQSRVPLAGPANADLLAEAEAVAAKLRTATGATSWAIVDADDPEHAICRACGERFQFTEEQTAHHFSRTCSPQLGRDPKPYVTSGQPQPPAPSNNQVSRACIIETAGAQPARLSPVL